MKWLLALSFFYLLMLSSMPCFCNEARENDDCTQQVSITDQHQGHEDDNCNSFCSCSCCSTSGLYYFRETIAIKNTVTFNQQKFPHYQQYFYFHNCHNIWQPPRLS